MNFSKTFRRSQQAILPKCNHTAQFSLCRLCRMHNYFSVVQLPSPGFFRLPAPRKQRRSCCRSTSPHRIGSGERVYLPGTIERCGSAKALPHAVILRNRGEVQFSAACRRPPRGHIRCPAASASPVYQRGSKRHPLVFFAPICAPPFGKYHRC